MHSFDKTMEDAMGVFDASSRDYRMTYLISANDYVVPYIKFEYERCVNLKQDYLDTLVMYFENAKD